MSAADTATKPAAAAAKADAKVAAADAKAPAATGPVAKKGKDGKSYESSVLPRAWQEKPAAGSGGSSAAPVDRTIWMLTVQDPKANANKTVDAGAAAATSGGSRVDPASGLVFPDMYYLLGERVTVGKKDAMQLAKCFKGTGHDTADWPSGLITVKCGRCDTKVESGAMTIQKHLRLIGKEKEKKITCRLMPRLLCDACYKYVWDLTSSTPQPLPAFAKLVAHKSYWTRWAELQPLVTFLSEDFITTMSGRVGNGRTAAPMTVNEHGQQTIRLVKDDGTGAEAGAASLAAPATGAAAVAQALLAAPAPSEAKVAAAPAGSCAACSKPHPGGDAPKYAACGGCGGVVYCGRDCQKAHWKTHKLTCKK